MGDNTRYSLADAAMGAFSVFFTQSPSFLDAQRTLQVKKGCNNTHTLFGMTQIPSDNHIRNLLDPVPPHELFPVFSSLVDGLNTAGHLEVYRSINGDLLVASGWHPSISLRPRSIASSAASSTTRTGRRPISIPQLRR